jgi:hypothetical protein
MLAYNRLQAWHARRLAKLRQIGYDAVDVVVKRQGPTCGKCADALGPYGFDAAPQLPRHPPAAYACGATLKYRGRWRRLNTIERFIVRKWEQFDVTAVRDLQVAVVVLAVVAAVVLLPFYVSAWIAAVPIVWREYPDLHRTTAGRVVAVLTMMEVAAALYLARRTARSFYGAAEIVVGVATSWFTLRSNEPGDAVTALKLGAAVYLMVRGADNLIEGWGKSTFWKSIFGRARRFWWRYQRSRRLTPR